MPRPRRASVLLPVYMDGAGAVSTAFRAEVARQSGESLEERIAKVSREGSERLVGRMRESEEKLEMALSMETVQQRQSSAKTMFEETKKHIAAMREAEAAEAEAAETQGGGAADEGAAAQAEPPRPSRGRRSSLLAPIPPAPSSVASTRADRTGAFPPALLPTLPAETAAQAEAPALLRRNRRQSVRVAQAFDDRLTSSLYDSGSVPNAEVAETGAAAAAPPTQHAFEFRGKRLSVLFDAKEFVQRNAVQEAERRAKLDKAYGRFGLKYAGTAEELKAKRKEAERKEAEQTVAEERRSKGITDETAGAVDYYTQDAVSTRHLLRMDARVLKQMEYWWNALRSQEDVDKHLGMCWDDYSDMCRALAKHLGFTISSKDIVDDWMRDTKGAKTLDFDHFAASIFELVDSWTTSISISVYVDFLQQALKGIRRHSKKFRSRIGEFRLRMAAERIASINGKSQPAFYSGSSDVAWSDTYTGFHKEAKSSVDLNELSRLAEPRRRRSMVHSDSTGAPMEYLPRAIEHSFYAAEAEEWLGTDWLGREISHSMSSDEVSPWPHRWYDATVNDRAGGPPPPYQTMRYAADRATVGEPPAGCFLMLRNVTSDREAAVEDTDPARAAPAEQASTTQEGQPDHAEPEQATKNAKSTRLSLSQRRMDMANKGESYSHKRGKYFPTEFRRKPVRDGPTLVPSTIALTASRKHLAPLDPPNVRRVGVPQPKSPSIPVDTIARSRQAPSFTQVLFNARSLGPVQKGTFPETQPPDSGGQPAMLLDHKAKLPVSTVDRLHAEHLVHGEVRDELWNSLLGYTSNASVRERSDAVAPGSAAGERPAYQLVVLAGPLSGDERSAPHTSLPSTARDNVRTWDVFRAASWDGTQPTAPPLPSMPPSHASTYDPARLVFSTAVGALLEPDASESVPIASITTESLALPDHDPPLDPKHALFLHRVAARTADAPFSRGEEGRPSSPRSAATMRLLDREILL